LSAARVDSGGDHRLAMAAVVGGLAAGGGETTVEGFSCVATSYPGFLDDLSSLGAGIRLRLVAIDGPAGSGKSTVSRALAGRLGIERLDTGAMYRAVAWAALQRRIDPADADAVAAIADGAVIELGPDGVSIDGADATAAIRRPEVNAAVSVVAANPAVRAALVARQRAWAARRGGGVVEGRDIGTVVFPGADLKVYLTASPEERARRRGDEAAGGVARRDALDSSRAASPLARADDARLLDTTGRTVDEVVEEIVSWL
jgi:cytidylate kinase